MKLLKILAGLLVLFFVALIVVGIFVDNIAKAAIETAGSEALGVTTTVEDCSVGLIHPSFKMEGLAVANPDGFGDEPFLALDSGYVAVSAASLSAEKIELPELTLDGVRMSLVQNAKGSNYGTILDNLKRYQGSAGDKGSSDEDGTRYEIETLRITGVVVTVVPEPALGLGALTLPIDRIELKGVGSDSDKGVLLSELAAIVVRSILDRATSSGQLPGMIQGALKGQLDSLRSKAEGEVRKHIDDAKKDVTDRLKGLIGR